MAIHRKNYSDTLAALRELTSNIPALVAKRGGIGPVQGAINQAGVEVLVYEASQGIFDARELVAKKAERQAKLERVVDLEMSFKAEEAGSELLLVIAIRDGQVGEEEIAAETAKIDSRARCLRVIGAAREDLESDLAEVEQLFAKLSPEAQKVVREPDALTPSERRAFQEIFDGIGAALFDNKSQLANV